MKMKLPDDIKNAKSKGITTILCTFTRFFRKDVLMRQIKRWVAIFVASIAGMNAWAQGGDASNLIINEIQVSNIDQYMDPSFNYGGWIELYNPTDEIIYLTGLEWGLFLPKDFERYGLTTTARKAATVPTRYVR